MSDPGNVSRASRLENLSPAQRALLEQRLVQRRSAVARANRIPARGISGPVPLSYAQELLWLLSQVFDDGIAYNAPSAFKLEGSLDLDLLGRAFDALIARHEILRTTYSVIDGSPRQLIPAPGPLEISVVDLRGLPAGEQEAEAQRVLKHESRFAFDLVNGPVMRPVVIRLSDREHILMVNMHHVATDGYSRTTIMRDLTVLYDAFARGVAAELPPLAIQYADYAIWQRTWLESGIAASQLEYWKRKLANAPSRLDLPTDFQRPPIRSYVGSHMRMMLDMPTREGLNRAARSRDATLFVSLLAVFSALLARYSGQDDVVIGTPFGGRTRTELESMVGYLINPLALRIDLSGDPTFNELIERARETTVDAFAHADVPYESVVRATNPERDLSQTPVFQAMIVLHNPAWETQRPRFEPEGIRCSEITHERGWSKFDVLLGCSHRSTGLNTTWEYSTELFRPATMQRMMEHFRTLAASAAADGECRVSRLSMLSEGERAQVLVSWNARAELPADQRSIKELFEAQVRQTPSATAVVCGEQRLTFDELNRRANRIAALLQSHDVGPGTFVGVLMEKSIALVPAVLGVIKAGGAYVPLDPNYPPDRLEFMISDVRPEVLLTQEHLLGSLPEFEVPTLTVDVPEALEPFSDENPDSVAGPDDLAYVIYTSGSTGLPKGAMIRNRSLTSAHHAYARAYRLSELTAHLQMASFSFDVFTGDLIRSLLVGAKLVLCPLEVVVDPPRLFELMVREGVDAAEFVPATASMLFEWAERDGKRLDFMRLVVVSSEAWRSERYAYFKRLCGSNTRLINAYGLTEATIDSTWYEPAPDAELIPGRFVPIGGPLDNTRIYILDHNLEPQPIGIPGELCVGGVAVARGYLNRPELTAEKFIPDPFSDEADALLYRTGDLARWLPDGTIDFMGRTDRQIKIRGFRIEPGEIESVLERNAGVQAAAVTDREDEGGSIRLVAYIVPSTPEQAIAPDELRALVAEHLPAYMIPSAWVVIDQLPLTPNGKVDVRALPAPQFDRSAAADEFVAPSTDTERALTSIWSDVLGVEEVGINDNFFAIGGHSLLAVRLFSEIESKLGTRIPLAALFQTATVAGLAELIEAQSAPQATSNGWSSLVAMRRGGDRRPPFFLVGWAGGEVLGYRDLVERLGEEASIYGLRAPGVDRNMLPIGTVEEMAAHYVAEVRQVQPQGPYWLGGYCFAGLVAYEMGRQLLDQGEDIEMLALIDAYPHGTRKPQPWLVQERMKIKALIESDWRGKAAWLRRRAGSLKHRVRENLYFTSGRFAYDILVAGNHGVPRGPWRLVLVASSRARKLYEPKPARLRVEFFRAQNTVMDDPTPWENLALGGVQLRPVIVSDIDHASIMREPHVQVLAAQMQAAFSTNGHGLKAADGVARNGGHGPDGAARNGGHGPDGAARNGGHGPDGANGESANGGHTPDTANISSPNRGPV